jgi:biotin carboxylase
MICKQKRIVIVDGYSTGRDLVRELLDRNVECLHLRSSPELPAAVAQCFDPTPYDGDLGYLGTPEEAVEVLRFMGPDAVVAGSEWGVSFAEEVAHGLGLPTNRIESLTARRDKFEMIEAVRGHGLRTAAQALLSSLEEAHAWADRHGEWPIVVKPLSSAGSDGVTVCHSHADIDAAFDNAFGQVNFMGGTNERLLVQSYLPGTQYVVNTVSWSGRHYVTDVWRMEHTVVGSTVIPQGMTLVDPRTPEARALTDYTLGVLDALGIRNGAAHSELKWTPDGPALIETGARVMGAAMDRCSYAAAGIPSQAAVLAMVLSGSDCERDDLFLRRHYRLRRQLALVLFNFSEAATVTDTEGLARLGDLPSFHAHHRGLKPGDKVWRTADWLARGGVMYLVHDSADQIAADIRAIRDLEKRGALYGLAAERPTLTAEA